MKYQSGQIWKIMKGAYIGHHVHIHHITHHEKIGEIIHVSVPEGQISHMPFSYHGLSASNMDYIRDDIQLNDDWKEGFEIWKTAFDEGDAGVFSITISESLDVMFETINTGEEVKPN